MMSFLGLDSYWYVSTLTFPGGILVCTYEDKISSCTHKFSVSIRVCILLGMIIIYSMYDKISVMSKLAIRSGYVVISLLFSIFIFEQLFKGKFMNRTRVFFWGGVRTLFNARFVNKVIKGYA